MSTQDKRIALIGLGGIAHLSHLKSFSETSGAQLVAGCDLDKKKFPLAEEKVGLKNFYTDYHEMFRKEKLDGVVIGTPNATHMPISVDALDAGVNVLCEKPVATSRLEAERIKEAVDRTGAKFMIGMPMRFRSENPTLRKMIVDGKLGNIYYAKTSYLRTRGIPGWGTWFTDKERAGGGAVLDIGVHMLDYVWFLLGKPAFKTVSALTFDGIGKRHLAGEEAAFGEVGYPSTYTGPEKNVFDVDEMTSAFIRLDGGAALQMEVSWAMNYNPEKHPNGGVIFGDRGGLSIMPPVFTHEVEDKLVHEPVEGPAGQGPQNLARAFVDYIDGKIDNPAPIEDGIQVMRTLDAIYESARTGREIAL